MYPTLLAAIADRAHPCWRASAVGVYNGPDAVKRAAIAGLGIAMVSKMTVAEELKARRLAEVDVRLPLPVRDIYVVDHPQKHHGAACSAMLALLARTFPLDPGCPAESSHGARRMMASVCYSWMARTRRAVNV